MLKLEKDFILNIIYLVLLWYLSSEPQFRKSKSVLWLCHLTNWSVLFFNITGNCLSDASLLTTPWVYDLLQIKTMLPGEHQQVLSNLQSRFDDFVEDSQESKIFTSADTAQLEREVNICKQYYQELLKSAERGKTLLRKVESCPHKRDCNSQYIFSV